MAEKQMYPGTGWTRPEAMETYGYGDSCCIPECKSTTLDKNKIKTGIGIFSFLSDDETRKKWLSVVKQFRRKGGHDSFTIKKTTKICEFHFDISCIKFGYSSGRKSLISGSIPTIFKFKK